MNPTTLRHTDDPGTCPACVTEGRALFGTAQYTEVEPLGPQDYGDHGAPDLQVTAALGRRFYTPRHDGTYAVIDVVFLGERADCSAATPTVTMQYTTYTICRDYTDPGGTELYSDERSRELPEETSCSRARLHALACEFDPATLNWNGELYGHLECEPDLQGQVVLADGVRQVPAVRVCRTHPASHALAYGATETAPENFDCDRNAGWLFVLETWDPCLPDERAYGQPRVELANLTRVRAAIRSNVLNREYEPAEALQVYRYVASGKLEPLVWRAVPHGNAAWLHVDDDYRKPVLGHTMYELVGPHPEGGGRLTQYTTVGVLLHGDS